MSATGITALDHSVQETNTWLKGLEEELQVDNRQQAYNALRAVLHTLRDRLPPEVAIKLGAQLPILVRGIYYEGWHAAATPTRRSASREISKTLARLASSPGVSRSNSKVAKPLWFKAWATVILRGLRRLDPLPWAKTIKPAGLSGTFNVPARPSGGIIKSEDVTNCELTIVCWLISPPRLS